MFHGFITRWLSVRLRAALLGFVANLDLYILVKFLSERGKCWVRVTKIASGFLNLSHCCALRLDGIKSQLNLSP